MELNTIKGSSFATSLNIGSDACFFVKVAKQIQTSRDFRKVVLGHSYIGVLIAILKKLDSKYSVSTAGSQPIIKKGHRNIPVKSGRP